MIRMHTMKKWTVAICASAFLSVTAFAASAEAGSIELKTTASKVVVTTDEDGEEKTSFVKPEVVVPGDRIAYTISATNVSTDDVEQVVITDPIPQQMLFVPGTEESQGATVLFSVDGGESFGRESELEVVENGLRRPAMPMDFTHIRWVFESPLSPTKERSVRFMALVQ